MNLVKRVTTIQVHSRTCVATCIQIVYMHNKAWKRVVVVILYFRITGSRTQPKQLNKK
jgi:hypothetical protein